MQKERKFLGNFEFQYIKVYSDKSKILTVFPFLSFFRSSENQDQRQERLDKKAEHMRELRASETTEQHQKRLDEQAEYNRKKIASETIEQSIERKRRMSEHNKIQKGKL